MYKTIMIAVLLLSIVLSVVFSPALALQASLSGITIWWKLVFPGLLPFLIMYELMLAFGLIHGLQSIFGPIASRLMKLPQAASLPFLMSVIGGSPIGVEPTLKLLENKTISNAEAQRLLGYIHFPNPIFVIVIIGAGFFAMPSVGFIIITIIWVTSLLLIIAHRFLPAQSGYSVDKTATTAAQSSFSRRMELGRRLDGRTLGKVLGDSVASSVQKLFIVGGFIIFSSVLASLVAGWLQPIAARLPFLTQALLEQHLGSYAIASWATTHAMLPLGVACIVACLSFSGLSGLLQVGFYTADTALRILPLLSYRFAHAIVSFFMTLLLWKPLNDLFSLLVRGVADKSAFIYSSEHLTNSTILAQELHSIWKESLFITCIFACLLFIYVNWYSRSHRARK